MGQYAGDGDSQASARAGSVAGDNYAERSLATKMARSTDEVLEFLNQLAAKSKPQAEKEIAELKAFVKDEHGVDDLQAWDIGYYRKAAPEAL